MQRRPAAHATAHRRTPAVNECADQRSQHATAEERCSDVPVRRRRADADRREVQWLVAGGVEIERLRGDTTTRQRRRGLDILRMPSTASDTVTCVDFAVAEAQRILELDDLRNDRTLRRVLRTEVPTPSGCPHAVAVTDTREVAAGRELV